MEFDPVGSAQSIPDMIKDDTLIEVLDEDLLSECLKHIILNVDDSLYILDKVQSKYKLLNRFKAVRHIYTDFGGSKFDSKKFVEFVRALGRCLHIDILDSIASTIEATFTKNDQLSIKINQNTQKISTESLKNKLADRQKKLMQIKCTDIDAGSEPDQTLHLIKEIKEKCGIDDITKANINYELISNSEFKKYFKEILKSEDPVVCQVFCKLWRENPCDSYIPMMINILPEVKYKNNSLLGNLLPIVAETCKEKSSIFDLIHQNLSTPRLTDQELLLSPISTNFYDQYIKFVQICCEIPEPKVLNEIIETIFDTNNRIKITETMSNFLIPHLSPALNYEKFNNFMMIYNEFFFSEHPHPLIGLVNLGCTCFMNSVLQQLFYTPEVKNLLFSVDPKDKSLIELVELFSQLEFCTKESYKPLKFFKYYDFQGDRLNPREQMDANELFTDLANKLCQEYPKDKNIFQFLVEITSQDASTDEVLFTNDEYGFCLNVDLNGPKTLEESLVKYKKPTFITMEYKGKNVQLRRTRTFKTLPRCLVINVQRFRIDAAGNAQIITSKYDFPTEMEMEGRHLELCGAVVHIGSMDFGHYISYRKVDDKWYQFNDAKVIEVSENQMKNDCVGGSPQSLHATMLFYRNLEFPVVYPKIPKEYGSYNVQRINVAHKISGSVFIDKIIDKILQFDCPTLYICQLQRTLLGRDAQSANAFYRKIFKSIYSLNSTIFSWEYYQLLISENQYVRKWMFKVLESNLRMEQDKEHYLIFISKNLAHSRKSFFRRPLDYCFKIFTLFDKLDFGDVDQNLCDCLEKFGTQDIPDDLVISCFKGRKELINTYIVRRANNIYDYTKSQEVKKLLSPYIISRKHSDHEIAHNGIGRSNYS